LKEKASSFTVHTSVNESENCGKMIASRWLYWWLFAWLACHGRFTSIFLLQRGLTVSEVGLILSL
jgi:hypothetical protein